MAACQRRAMSAQCEALRRDSTDSRATTVRGMDSGASSSSAMGEDGKGSSVASMAGKMFKSALATAKSWRSRRSSNGDISYERPGSAKRRSPREAEPEEPTRASRRRDFEAAAAEPPKAHFKVGKIYELLLGRLSMVAVTGDEMARKYINKYSDIFFFSGDHQELYVPFCHDFGPVNLSAVHGFCGLMRKYWNLEELRGKHLAYYCEEDLHVRTNTAFLLAAFMVCELGATPEEAWAPFRACGEGAFATFRDATFCKQDYHLTIEACLRGLSKAMACGWYSPDAFCPEEYEYLDNPSNADMHVVSPKLAAFKGPSARREQVAPGIFTFTPRHYSEVFRELGITAVVRLNEPGTYDAAGFTREGFNHYDLYFDDCTTPDAAVVDRFLEICEAEKGMVAVHCKAGLGRTGTLIAVYLMKHFGWTASECIGWLRIVRPGSVIGPQQQYLHWAEGVYRKGAEAPRGTRRKEFKHNLSFDASETMGLQVAAAQNTRAEKRRPREGGGTSLGSFDLEGGGRCGSHALE